MPAVSCPFREEAPLTRSLSALVPVRNVQSRLTPMVLEMLEILSELTSPVEVMIIDDGSSDATIEVADELCGRYPQLRAVGHTRPRGRSAAIATGLARSHGETVFIPDEEDRLAVVELAKMWDALAECDVVLGRSGGASGGAGWLRRSSGRRGGFVLGYRAVIEAIRPLLVDPLALRSHLLRHDYRWHELEIAARRTPPAPHRRGSWRNPLIARGKAAVPAGRPAGVLFAPNYLSPWCDFAVGK
jgi:glycosyltransferase involved in cell wall biosynthesis